MRTKSRWVTISWSSQSTRTNFVPVAGEASAAVDDDGFPDGNPAGAVSDVDANVGDAPSDTSELTFTGTLPGSGGNGALAFSLAGMDLVTDTISETVQYHWNGGTLTATITGGDRAGLDLFQVLITDPTTGAYQLTLLRPVLHVAGGNEASIFATISYKVGNSDADNSAADTANGTLTIQLIDDIPVADNDANSVTEGLGNSTTGNVFAGSANLGDDADTIGADGAAAGGAVTGARTGTEAAGGALTAVPALGVTITGTYGDLLVNPNGSYTYTLTAVLIPVGVTSETFTYEIKDGDGDTDLAQLVIGLTQNALVPDTTGSTETVFEDGLADGVQHGAASETTTGTFTVNGNNENYTLTLDGDVGGPVTITAVNDVVTTSKGTLTITSISAPGLGGVVTYGYSYTLNAAQTHTGQGEVNPLSDTITMAVTDATGDSDPSPASIVISIGDDIPVADNDTNAVTEGLGNSTTGNVYGAAA